MSLLRWLPILLVTLAVSGTSPAQDAEAGRALAERVTEARLENGLRILMVEDRSAPVIAFNLMFAVGGVDEPEGLGGIAHMVEHMAFKGTSTIGSLDPRAEEAALDAVEVLALALERARAGEDPDAVARAEEAFAAARDRSQQLAAPSALDDLLSRAGAVGLNASTGYDYTSYVVELPSNRLELYARVYADVLRDPVFRYFYSEREVVRQERRQRSEDDPRGYLYEAFLATAFELHRYGRSLIGPAETIESYRAVEARAFFDAFYHPSQAVLVLVGDVDPQRDLQVLERYFGAVEAGSPPLALTRSEPPQAGERRVRLAYDAEPQLAMGWHKPTYPHRDAYALDLADALLTSGRTSRLYRRLILGDRLALDVSSSSAFPGTRYPNLFLVTAQPRAPHGPAEVEAAIEEEIERLKSEPVSAEELEKVKNRVRAATVRGLASNSGLAAALAYNELFAGGWERLVEDLEIYESIDAREIQEAAQRWLRPENRTVAVLTREADEGQSGGER